MTLSLVVDDERDLLSALGCDLEREGFDTRTATTGAAALEEPRPDLFINPENERTGRHAEDRYG